jgi:hypothetical protein
MTLLKQTQRWAAPTAHYTHKPSRRKSSAFRLKNYYSVGSNNNDNNNTIICLHARSFLADIIDTIMADNGFVNIFVYLGGEQEVPRNVTHVIIDRSVNIIPERAFSYREQLVSAKTHDGIEIIEEWAFGHCTSLREIKLLGVKEVGSWAFNYCRALTDVEFGDKLETIGPLAFNECSLRHITMPSVRTIGRHAFADCKQLTDAELPAVERIGEFAFTRCENLQRIVIPLKDNMFLLHPYYQRYDQFDDCDNLTKVDLVGGIHKTIS